jgi:hypothetical protein
MVAGPLMDAVLTIELGGGDRALRFNASPAATDHCCSRGLGTLGLSGTRVIIPSLAIPRATQKLRSQFRKSIPKVLDSTNHRCRLLVLLVRLEKELDASS